MRTAANKIEKDFFNTLEHHTRNAILILRYKLVKAGIPKAIVIFFLLKAEDILGLAFLLHKKRG